MKILYTNISPITNAYTNINHLFYLKKQNPQKVSDIKQRRYLHGQKFQFAILHGVAKKIQRTKHET